MEKLKTQKQKIDYFKRLIKTANQLHKEYPLGDYNLLIPHYKRQIKRLEEKRPGWKKDTENKTFIHYVRNNDDGVISLNYRLISDCWGFSYFPIGDSGKGKHIKKENLTKGQAIKLANKHMRDNP